MCHGSLRLPSAGTQCGSSDGVFNGAAVFQAYLPDVMRSGAQELAFKVLEVPPGAQTDMAIGASGAGQGQAPAGAAHGGQCCARCTCTQCLPRSISHWPRRYCYSSTEPRAPHSLLRGHRHHRGSTHAAHHASCGYTGRHTRCCACGCGTAAAHAGAAQPCSMATCGCRLLARCACPAGVGTK
jgi:hypothetical protein